ncbi:MAG: histidine phosphatase family protein [Bifidobacteriaceae bacterium]|nr:histidine phosphatase family protein [Bifidobacteriaceae bacterium]
MSQEHYGRIVLLRHGETAWSISGQHTGRTNIPLTFTGEDQARDAGERLRSRFPEGFPPDHIFVSPLERAQSTAQLAGFTNYQVTSQIAEWDYGPAEGRTRSMMAQALGVPSWNVWDTGPLDLPEDLQGEHNEMLPDGTMVHVVNGRGESAEDAARRTSGLLDTIEPILLGGEDVLCVAHAHILRLLTSVWLGQPADFARHLELDTAHFAILGFHNDEHVIEAWNL